MRAGQHPCMDPAKGGKPYTVKYYYGLWRVKDSNGWYVAQSKNEAKCRKEAKRLNNGGKVKYGLDQLYF